ncbi:uncharacterized protein JCM15063_004991 [Sporobolomyces koalae]|uniref:uncharacterized protein n=1 Tax=Sporobolomyces koalae TaxID=500713 RepID=UPI0031720C1B
MPSKHEKRLLKASSVLSRSTVTILRSFSTIASTPQPLSALPPALDPSVERAVVLPQPWIDEPLDIYVPRRRSSKRQWACARDVDAASDQNRLVTTSVAPDPPFVFTNLNPFACLPREVEAKVACETPVRRLSGEMRAAAANKLRMIAREEGVVKRRKSAVELEGMTDRVRVSRLSSIKAERRRSSSARRRTSSLTPRRSPSSDISEIPPSFCPNPPLTAAPLFSPVLDRRAAFCDEMPCSPPLSTTSPQLQPPALFNSPSSASLQRLQPRQARPFPLPDLDPVQRLRLPLVFPSPTPRRTSGCERQCPVGIEARPKIDEEEEQAGHEDQLQTAEQSPARFCFFDNVPPLSLPSTSDAPAPNDAPAPTRILPNFRLEMPSANQSLQSLLSRGERRFSTASSYHNSSPGHRLLTPGSIIFHQRSTPSPVSTSATTDIFAHAFGSVLDAPGLP